MYQTHKGTPMPGYYLQLRVKTLIAGTPQDLDKSINQFLEEYPTQIASVNIGGIAETDAEVQRLTAAVIYYQLTKIK